LKSAATEEIARQLEERSDEENPRHPEERSDEGPLCAEEIAVVS
jgi:hypothetical protein